MRRGEVWWAQFDQQHPVVLLSEDPAHGPAPDQGHQESSMRAVQLVAASGVDVGGLGREVPVATIDGLPPDAVVRVAFPVPVSSPAPGSPRSRAPT